MINHHRVIGRFVRLALIVSRTTLVHGPSEHRTTHLLGQRRRNSSCRASRSDGLRGLPRAFFEASCFIRQWLRDLHAAQRIQSKMPHQAAYILERIQCSIYYSSSIPFGQAVPIVNCNALSSAIKARQTHNPANKAIIINPLESKHRNASAIVHLPSRSLARVADRLSNTG